VFLSVRKKRRRSPETHQRASGLSGQHHKRDFASGSVGSLVVSRFRPRSLKAFNCCCRFAQGAWMARVCEPHSPSILSRDVGSVDSTRLLRSARAVVSLRKAPFASISCRVRLEWHAQLIATFLRFGCTRSFFRCTASILEAQQQGLSSLCVVLRISVCFWAWLLRGCSVGILYVP